MNETTDAAAIFAPLWRRKWLILAVAIVVGVGSYVYYRHRPATYQANTVVYFGAASEEAPPGEKPTPKNQGVTVLDRVAVINSIVLESVRNQLRDQGRVALARRGKVRAKGSETGEFITITTEARSGKDAALLANLVAQTYIKRARSQRRRGIEQSIAITTRQLRRIEKANASKVEAAGKGKGSTSPTTASILEAANLNSKINQLESSLAVAGAQQLRPARAAGTLQTAPKPRQNAIFGFVLGLVLAAIAAYVLSRFDRRVRSLPGIEQTFQAQIFAALPAVRRPIVQRDGVRRPSKLLIEPLRRLHTGLRLTDTLTSEPGRTPSVLLVMSPDAGDGKSTLVADLALVKCDAGERVAVVEANFRRPVQAKLLGLGDPPGLAQVLTGTLALGEAVQRASARDAVGLAESALEGPAVATTVQARAGSIFLLAGEASVANPPTLLAQPAMKDLLGSLRADFDSVLVDAPSPLEVSDVMPLLKEVDGIVLVARIGQTRESSARRLVQLLTQTTSAPILGVAANCVAAKDMERYGFSSFNGQRWPARLLGR
jgi:Mrp family chromosome partitioning ATPase/capsular polysaccharide biosynthesis protein